MNSEPDAEKESLLLTILALWTTPILLILTFGVAIVFRHDKTATEPSIAIPLTLFLIAWITLAGVFQRRLLAIMVKYKQGWFGCLVAGMVAADVMWYLLGKSAFDAVAIKSILRTLMMIAIGWISVRVLWKRNA